MQHTSNITTRLEAFSDGVMAVIITVMVLELHTPESPDIQSLLRVLPMALIYLLSFVVIGIFWNNHNYLLRTAPRLTPSLMWANLHFLFWLSLIPFVTRWLGENHTSTWPTAIYGLVLLLAGAAYQILQQVLTKHPGQRLDLKKRFGNDLKGKMSLTSYALAIICAFWLWWLADLFYVLPAVMWLIPDRRIEQI